MIGPGLRLALGTFTIVPVGDIGEIDRPTARVAMLTAPIAAIPVGVGVFLTLVMGRLLDLPSLVVGFATVAVAAYLTRGMHIDGLADVVDGLGAGWNRERALEVMKSGDVGPMGVLALLTNTGVQAACVAALADSPLLVATCWTVSRVACTLTAGSSLRAARPDGMGALMANSLRPVEAILAATGYVLVALGFAALEPRVAQALVGAVFALGGIGFLLWRARRVFGGVTGDVFGAAVEIACTLWLVGLCTGLGG